MDRKVARNPLLRLASAVSAQFDKKYLPFEIKLTMKKTLIFFFIFCSFSVKSQQLDSNELYDKVVLLKDIQGKIINTGTGFLLSTENQYFLVTAKHVADSPKIETSEIFFRDSNHTSI